MRTTTELIRELHSEAAKFAVVMLVVGFADRGSLFIVDDDPDALPKLEQAMHDGGRPIGLINVAENWTDREQLELEQSPQERVICRGRMTFNARLLSEWCGNDKAMSFLRRIVESTAKRFLDSAPSISEDFRETFSDVSEVRMRREWSN
jgi:hypothetical protein